MRFRWRPSRLGGWACCHQSQVRVSQNTLSLDSRHLYLPPHNSFLPTGLKGKWDFLGGGQPTVPWGHSLPTYAYSHICILIIWKQKWVPDSSPVLKGERVGCFNGRGKGVGGNLFGRTSTSSDLWGAMAVQVRHRVKALYHQSPSGH